MINCETEFDLLCLKACITTEVSRIFREVDPSTDPAVYKLVTAINGATFQTNNKKRYVPVVTLFINDNIKL